jgi:hypothetical protein
VIVFLDVTAALLSVVVENAIQALHQIDVLTALGVHWLVEVGFAVERGVGLFVTAMAEGDAVSGVQLRPGHEALSTDVMGR